MPNAVKGTVTRRGNRYYCLPPFALNDRRQEAARKRIVHDLAVEANDLERRAARARWLAESIQNVDALHNKNALERLIEFRCVRQDVARLFGVEDLWLEVALGQLRPPSPSLGFDERRLLFGCIDGHSWVPNYPTDRDRAKATAKAAPAKDPIAEAAGIVADAQRVAAMDEIDWTENPKDEQERALRAAIMKVIEKENFRVWSEPIWFWIRDLQRLAPHDAEFIGEDLYDEIERAKKLYREQRAANAREEKSKLMSQALREIDSAEGSDPQ